MRISKHAGWMVLGALLGVWSGTAAAEDVIDRFDDPDAKATGTGSANRIVLEAGDADAKATARLAQTFKIASEKYGRYSFTLTAPFDSKKASKVDVGTLSGLTAGTTATLEFGVLLGPSASNQEFGALSQSCDAAIPRLIPGYTWTQVSVLAQDNLNCNRDILDRKKLDEAVKVINEKRDGCKKCRQVPGAERPLCEVLQDSRRQSCKPATSSDAVPSALCALVSSEEDQRECAACATWTPAQSEDCSQVGARAKVADNVDDVIEAIKAEVTARTIQAFRPLHGLSVSLKANEQDFTYVLAADPVTKKESSETGYGASVAYTYAGRTTLWTAGYSHEESYKAAGKVQICSPIGTTGSTSCSEGSIGAPQKQKAELAFLENRWIAAVEHFALAPRVEYDLKKSQWAVRVPLYFITNQRKQFTGGVTLGYSEADDEGFGAAVFVSKAFTFFD